LALQFETLFRKMTEFSDCVKRTESLSCVFTFTCYYGGVESLARNVAVWHTMQESEEIHMEIVVLFVVPTIAILGFVSTVNAIAEAK
jgi:hypothetical protein